MKGSLDAFVVLLPCATALLFATASTAPYGRISEYIPHSLCYTRGKRAQLSFLKVSQSCADGNVKRDLVNDMT